MRTTDDAIKEEAMIEVTPNWRLFTTNRDTNFLADNSSFQKVYFSYQIPQFLIDYPKCAPAFFVKVENSGVVGVVGESRMAGQ